VIAEVYEINVLQVRKEKFMGFCLSYTCTIYVAYISWVVVIFVNTKQDKLYKNSDNVTFCFTFI